MTIGPAITRCLEFVVRVPHLLAFRKGMVGKAHPTGFVRWAKLIDGLVGWTLPTGPHERDAALVLRNPHRSKRYLWLRPLMSVAMPRAAALVLSSLFLFSGADTPVRTPNVPESALSAQLGRQSDSARPTPALEVGPSHAAQDTTRRGTVPWPPRPIRNFSFGVGETLHYDIGWQSIVAGKGQMVVNAPVDTNQRLCFPVVSTVESTPFFSTFYRVDDSAVSFIDVRQIYPVRFEKYLREGKYRSDQIADFDATTGKAYTPKDTLDIPAYVQDALSLLYYVRTLDMKPETEFTVDNFTGKKSYTLTVRILHRERIEVKAGTFSTIVVEPLLQAAGLFKQEGKLKVWLTDDRLHLPVLMKSKVLVGSIVAELTDYRLGTVRRYSP